jgi:predicted double-glycine peptidase
VTKKICYLSIIITVFVLSSSCAAVKEVREGRDVHLIERVPFFPQEDYQCGPASLAGVLNYWGIHVTPSDIAGEIFSKTAGGTLNIDMALYAQKKGLISAQYRGNSVDLKKNIDSGYPVIVLVDYGFSLYQKNHFMVIVGYNENGVIANSGRKKGVFIREKDFLKTWEKTDFWTLLIKPR